MALPAIGTIETALSNLLLVGAEDQTTASARKLHALVQEVATFCMKCDREQGTTTYALLFSNLNFDQDFKDIA
jgi:hypothetical protein